MSRTTSNPVASIRVLVVEDHELVCSGFCRLLNAEKGLEVVGQTSNGLDAVALCEELRPDVVVVDLTLPDISGVETIRRLRERVPSTKAMVLSASAEPGDIAAAFHAGAKGYIRKGSCRYEGLFAAISTVHYGHYVAHSEIVQTILLSAAGRDLNSTLSGP